MEDYFYYLPGEKPEKAPAYVDIGDFRVWGVWIKEERLLQYLTDRTIARKKARKKNSQTVYSLLRRLWKRKIGIQKTEDIAGAACVDLKDPMHKVASEALKKRLPGEDLLMWDFPGKLYLAFGRDMLQKLFEGQEQITLFCLLSEETDHELPQFLADQALYLQELVFFAPAYGTDRAEDMLEEIYEETGLVGSCSGYEKLPLYLADRQQYEHPMIGGYAPVFADGCMTGNVYGSYVHGIFDAGDLAYRIAETLAERKGRSLHAGVTDYAAFKEEQYDKLAETMREYLDMDAVYGMLREAKL